MIGYEDCIKGLNDASRDIRLSSLRRLKEGMDQGKIPYPKKMGYINNHIHTTYPSTLLTHQSHLDGF